MHVNSTWTPQYPVNSRDPRSGPGLCTIGWGNFKQVSVTPPGFENMGSAPKSRTPVNSVSEKRTAREIRYKKSGAKNKNEKKRLAKMKQAFHDLKNKLPEGAERKLSRVQILRQATAYIKELGQLLSDNPPDQSEVMDAFIRQSHLRVDHRLSIPCYWCGFNNPVYTYNGVV